MSGAYEWADPADPGVLLEIEQHTRCGGRGCVACHFSGDVVTGSMRPISVPGRYW